MEKSRLLGAVCAGVLIFISMSSHAALVDNGGGLIYDDVLDITWAQPDTTARTWVAANAWASGLTLGGVSGWRLPYISVEAGVGPTNSFVDCNGASELACRDNELGYMFWYNTDGTGISPLFPTASATFYWYGTLFSSEEAWAFFFGIDASGGYGTGLAVTDGILNNPNLAWAVHAGNVVPVPAAVWLFGSGLVGLIGVARRKA